MGRSGRRVQGNFIRPGQRPEVRQNYDGPAELSQKAQRFTSTKKLMTSALLLLAFIASTLASSATPIARVHNRTEHFIDIEAPANQLKIECSNGNPTSGNYYMGFDIFDGREVYSFFYRRPLSLTLCRQEEKEYQLILNGAKTVRIVGIHPNEIMQSYPQQLKSKDLKKAPVAKVVKWTNSAFARLQVGEKCKAYFPDGCDLPKNYWANTIPRNQK